MNGESVRPTKKRKLPVDERQRAVRACGECRRLKEKCEDGIPCKRCRHLNRPCELTAPPSAEERKASTKELVDRVQYMSQILKHHLPDIALDLDSLKRTCDALPTRNAPVDRTAVVVASQHQDGDSQTQPHPQSDESPGIEDENCTIDYVDGATTHYSGEFSHWNFSMHIKRNLNEIISGSNEPNLRSVHSVPDFIRVGEADPGSTSILDVVAVLPPRPVAGFLIDVFFKHATSFYYYLDRAWLDLAIDHIYVDSASLSSKDVTEACLILMVLAVGTQYVHLESPEQKNKRSNNASGTTNAQVNWELDIGSAFYRQVAKLLSEVIHAGSLLSVQVFLLLGLYSLPVDASGLSYIYFNLAIKVAIQNGMHREISRGKIDESTKEYRRRIWWTVYCMERKIGVYHGRPASIARSDIDTDLPKNSQTSTDIDSFDVSGLLESINLTTQAEAFLHEISCLRTCSRTEVTQILSRIKQMKLKLHRPWHPHGGRLVATPSNDVKEAMSRLELHAQLECCLLHIFIGRPFILAHRQVRDKARSNRNTPSRVSKSQEQWNFLVEDCVAAAKEVIFVCHCMQTGPLGLAKSSYTEYSSCRAALLVLIAYSICYRTNEFSSTLKRGLDAIREMASVGESARSEVSLIETLEAASQQLHVFNARSQQPLPPPPPPSNATEEGYDGLLNWYTKVSGSSNSRTTPLPVEGVDPALEVSPRTQQPGLQRYDNSGNLRGSVGSNDMFVEEFPFDFDLFNADSSMAFFPSDWSTTSNPEKELFEHLFWAPQ